MKIFLLIVSLVVAYCLAGGMGVLVVGCTAAIVRAISD